MLSKHGRKLLIWFSKHRDPAIPDESKSDIVDYLLQIGYIRPVYPDYDFDDELFLERGRSPVGYKITEAGFGYLLEHSNVRSNIAIFLSITAIIISILANLPEITGSINMVLSSFRALSGL